MEHVVKTSLLNAFNFQIIEFLDIIHCPSAQLSRLLPEEGNRIQSPKRCVLNKKRDDG
jgi:hypothetical protein